MAPQTNFQKAQLAIEGGSTLTCWFNPQQYAISKSNEWRAHWIVGASLPAIQFGGGFGRELSLELLFDASDSAAGDVRPVTDQLFLVMEATQPAVDASGAADDPYPFVLQNDETDWQLVWRLASTLDYEVVGDGSTVHFRPAGLPGDAPIALRAPDDLISFRPRISGAQQVESVVVRGWDLANAQAIVASQQPPSADSTPGIERSAIASAVHAGTWTVGDRAVTSQAEADALAASMASRMGNAWIEAEGLTNGDPRLKAGSRVSVSGVGSRFGGDYVITSVTHLLAGGRGYQTQFTVSGRSSRTILDLVDTSAAAPGWGAAVVVGVVSQTQDPEGMGRVRVTYPALGDNAEGWWARIAAPAAGQGRGLLMMPVIGDEVVLAFEQGDPRRPYVLGAVWNGQAKPGDDLVKQDGSFVLASDHDIALAAANQATVSAKQGTLALGGNDVSVEAAQTIHITGATVEVQSTAR
ncbi:MAG: phage baseplate assembly protein V [Solirubrobacteraceae bacterium]|jgi:hypothetical protein